MLIFRIVDLLGMEIVESRFHNLKEIYDQITEEINKKSEYTIYYLFIFWIWTAIVLLLLQEIIEMRVQKKKKFHFGIMNRLAQFLFDTVKNLIAVASD